LLAWLNALMVIVAIPAVLGWLVVATSAVQIMLLVPAGQRMAGYNDLGMWRFGRLRERIGPKAEPHLARMRLGGIAFALCILVVLLLVALSIPLQERAPVADTAALIGPANGVLDA
jgi:hypothetical protein